MMLCYAEVWTSLNSCCKSVQTRDVEAVKYLWKQKQKHFEERS